MPDEFKSQFERALSGIPDELAGTLEDKRLAWNGASYILVMMLRGLGDSAPNRFTYVFDYYDGEDFEITVSRVKGESQLVALQKACAERDQLREHLALHADGHCVCGGEGRCTWCRMTAAEEERNTLLTRVAGYEVELAEVVQSLGRALGYPPNPNGAPGVCTGDHSPASLATEAARRIVGAATASANDQGEEVSRG